MEGERDFGLRIEIRRAGSVNSGIQDSSANDVVCTSLGIFDIFERFRRFLRRCPIAKRGIFEGDGGIFGRGPGIRSLATLVLRKASATPGRRVLMRTDHG